MSDSNFRLRILIGHFIYSLDGHSYIKLLKEFTASQNLRVYIFE